MHMHRLEKIWVGFGVSMIVVFLAVLGISSFAYGYQTPSDHRHVIDPAKVRETAPFDKPGLTKIGENEYDAVMLAFVFGYSPDKMEVPAGSTVHFQVASTDVVHGFQIVGTNVNAMIVPGEVSHFTHTFDEPGEYLVICNEYCGSAHEMMKTTIIVK